MKWTTAYPATQDPKGHVCSPACRVFEKNGKKYVSHYVESGVVHNPPCRSARCRRRKENKGGP